MPWALCLISYTQRVSKAIRQLLLPSFYEWEKWGLESMSDSKATGTCQVEKPRLTASQSHFPWTIPTPSNWVSELLHSQGCPALNVGWPSEFLDRPQYSRENEKMEGLGPRVGCLLIPCGRQHNNARQTRRGYSVGFQGRQTGSCTLALSFCNLAWSIEFSWALHFPDNCLPEGTLRN